MQAVNQSTILLIERKQKTGDTFGADLAKKGFHLGTAESGASGIELLGELNPLVLVVNAASLRTNGLRIVNRFRNLLPDTPIILILSAEEKISVPNTANVVMHLPFTVQKLVNRIRVFTNSEARHIISCGNLKLNDQTHMVTYNGREKHLTPRLSKLLKLLMTNVGKVQLREELFKEVWETDYTGDTRTLDVHISWLRQALEENPRHPNLIVTARGVGYKLII